MGLMTSSLEVVKSTSQIAPIAGEIVAIPTRFMTNKDNDYAVAFAVPGGWDGVKILIRPANHHERRYLKCFHRGNRRH